jgi:hypothetical protein
MWRGCLRAKSERQQTTPPEFEEPDVFSSDPHLMLSLHDQRSRQLRDEAAADSLADRLRRRVKPTDWTKPARGHHRRRAPVIP